MIWRTATLLDLETLQKCALCNDNFSNNYGAVNSILYNKKYQAQISFDGGWFFEKLNYGGRGYFSFPRKLDITGVQNQAALADAAFDKTKAAVLALADEAKKLGLAFVFENITAQEKDALVKIFPGAKVSSSPEFADYIYRAADLASLDGKKYGKKRNHIHQFEKKYSDYRLERLTEQNLYIARALEEKWLEENFLSAKESGFLDDLQAEKEIIFYALENFCAFKKTCALDGGILFVEEKPAAFCVSSLLSRQVTDIHFEKCLFDFAKDGGYAVINNEFSKTVQTEFINREEDLGIEGLRKAKLSYYPERMIEKFLVQIEL